MTTSLARRPETGGGSPQAVPAGPAAAGYMLPATRARHRRPGSRGGRHTDWALGRPVPGFILLPSRYPPPAASRAPARVLAVTTRGRSGPRLAGEGKTSP